MGGVAFGNMARMGFYQTTTNDVFCVSSGTHMYVFNATTGARILNAEFDLAGNADNVTALGSLASNDFERFESAPNYSWPDMTVTPYTNVDWNGVDGDTWWAAYTWADTDAGGSGTHETNMSSLSSVTMKKRAQMTVTAPPLPDPVAGVGNPRGVDDVNAFRIYMQHGVVAPSRVNLWKQPVQPVNLATSVVLSTLPVWSGTTNPPISSTFPSQAPAVIRSDAVGTDGDPKVLLNGEGVALFETIKVAGEGALSLQGRAFEQLLYGIRTQSILSGGGKVSVSTAYEVKWSYRFRTMAGRGPRTATAGYFDVVVPATGFVVPGVGGATAKTVTAGGIPLNAGDALYYALPYSGSSASVSGNFRVAGYTSDFTIPNDWILLCARDLGSSVIDFTMGFSLAPGTDRWEPVDWKNITTFSNSWVAFGGSTYSQPQYSRESDGWVNFRGLVKSGAVGVITTMPVDFRPSTGVGHEIFILQSNTGAARVEARTDGTLYLHTYLSGGSNVHVSLSGLRYRIN
jgi:hypothetical protein